MKHNILKIASWSLGQRIAKNKGLSSKIIDRLSGKPTSRNDSLRVATVMTNAAKKNTKDGIASLRRLLKHDVDGLRNTSLKDPIKRASYFKGKEGIGKLLIGSENVKTIMKSNKKNSLAETIKRKAGEASIAHDNLLSSNKKSYGDASKLFTFKSFSKKPLSFEHITDKGNAAGVSKAIRDGTMSNHSSAAQFMAQSNMPTGKGFYAYPSRSPSYDSKTHSLVSGKIPANKVIFGRETNGISYDAGDKLMPEMFIKSNNSRHIDRKSINIK